MQNSELFKIENKEFAIRSSESVCEFCSEILANFEAMMFGTHCSACHYTNQVSVVTDRLKKKKGKLKWYCFKLTLGLTRPLQKQHATSKWMNIIWSSTNSRRCSVTEKSSTLRLSSNLRVSWEGRAAVIKLLSKYWTYLRLRLDNREFLRQIYFTN